MGWSELLDEMDRRLALVHEALQLHQMVPVFPPLPRASGPLPSPLAERARSTLARTDACEQAVRRRVAVASAAQHTLRPVAREPVVVDQVPAFIDLRA